MSLSSRSSSASGSVSKTNFKIQRYYVRNNWFLKQSIRILYTVDRYRTEFSRNETIQIAQILLQIGFEIEPERRNRKELHEYNRLMCFLSETIYKRLYVNDVFRSIVMVHSDEVIFRFIRRAIHHTNILGQIDKQTNKSICCILFREQVKNQVTEMISKNVREHENKLRSNFNDLFASDETVMDTIRQDLERFRLERETEPVEKLLKDDSVGASSSHSDRDTVNFFDTSTEANNGQPEALERKQWIFKHLETLKTEMRKRFNLRQRAFWERNRNDSIENLKEEKRKKNANNGNVKLSQKRTVTAADNVRGAVQQPVQSIDRICDYCNPNYDQVLVPFSNECGFCDAFDFDLFKVKEWSTFKPNSIEAFVSRTSFLNLRKLYGMKKTRQAQTMSEANKKENEIRAKLQKNATIARMAAEMRAKPVPATIDEIMDKVTATMSKQAAERRAERAAEIAAATGEPPRPIRPTARMSFGRSMLRSALRYHSKMLTKPSTATSTVTSSSNTLTATVSTTTTSVDSTPVKQDSKWSLTGKREHSDDDDETSVPPSQRSSSTEKN